MLWIVLSVVLTPLLISATGWHLHLLKCDDL